MAYIDLKRNSIVRRLEKAAVGKGGRGLEAEEIVEVLNRGDVADPWELCDALVAEGILFLRVMKNTCRGAASSPVESF